METFIKTINELELHGKCRKMSWNYELELHGKCRKMSWNYELELHIIYCKMICGDKEY
jgi:hypothetical protein